jgi:hypothetical protein
MGDGDGQKVVCDGELPTSSFDDGANSFQGSPGSGFCSYDSGTTPSSSALGWWCSRWVVEA